MKIINKSKRMAAKWAARTAATVGILAICTLFVLPAGQDACAYDNTMRTDRYNVDIDVFEDNTYAFRETIDIYYVEPHHGIYRYIPMSGYRISDVKVPGYNYETYKQSGNYVVKIGSGDYSLTGANRYELNYRITMYKDDNEDMDMLLLNVIPTGWQTDIAKASGTITLPKKADLSKVKVFSGTYGIEGNYDNAEITTDSDGRTIHYSATNLPANHGITITLELPQGYWVGAKEFGALSPLAMLLFLLGPVGAAVLWFLYGRDEHMVRTLEFYPPEDLTPGEIGYLIDRSVDERDVVSTIVYLADKGYMSIEEDDRGQFWFEALNEPGDEEPKYVRTIYGGIFSGDRVKVNSRKMGKSFGKKYLKAMSQLTSMYSGNRTFNRPESVTARILCALSAFMPVIAFCRWASVNGNDSAMFYLVWSIPNILVTTVLVWTVYDKIYNTSKVKLVTKSIAAICAFSVGLMPVLMISDSLGFVKKSRLMLIVGAVIIGTLVSIFFSVISIAKKKSYTRLLGKILGFRDFIKTAELDKLNELVEQDPEYFYHIVPYAYVLGLSSRWIRNFENIPITKPNWYRSSYYDRFDYYMMGRMMSDCSQSVSNNISIPVSSTGGGSGGGSSWSGGGGFSGGGFSGGGAGGGGGGGW